MKRIAKFTLIIGILIGFEWLVATMIKDQRNPTARHRTIPSTAIVGIWQNTQGTIIDLRADGTLRWKSTGDSTDSIQYCNYSLRGVRFSIVYPTKPDDYLRRVKQAVYWQPDDNFILTHFNNSELHLLDPASDETDVLKRLEYADFDAVP